MFRLWYRSFNLSRKLAFSSQCQVCHYYSYGNTTARRDGIHVIDLRSDTVTKPTPAMREAMANAEVGDDVYGEDPTVNELQRRCAKMFGMEDALIVSSGTMGNLISVLSHIQSRFTEAIVGEKSHMFLDEVAGMAELAGVQCHPVQNLPDGTFDLEDLVERICNLDDVHRPWTQLICLENTHCFSGGKALPLNFLKEVRQIANKNKLRVHLDGARVMNAAVALGVPPGDILQYFDSVSMCFSKGLACPVGSIIAGSKDFIERALRARKALGGGMRQAGVLAAAMMVSLDTILPRLHEDHERAQRISKAIMKPSNKVLTIDVEGVHSNIIMVDIIGSDMTPEDLSKRMNNITDKEHSELGESISLLMLPYSKTRVRLVTHNDVSHEDVEKTIKKFQYVIKEMSS